MEIELHNRHIEEFNVDFEKAFNSLQSQLTAEEVLWLDEDGEVIEKRLDRETELLPLYVYERDSKDSTWDGKPNVILKLQSPLSKQDILKHLQSLLSGYEKSVGL